MSCGVVRGMSCGVVRGMSCGVVGGMSCGVVRGMSCGVVRGMSCGVVGGDVLWRCGPTVHTQRVKGPTKIEQLVGVTPWTTVHMV